MNKKIENEICLCNLGYYSCLLKPLNGRTLSIEKRLSKNHSISGPKKARHESAQTNELVAVEVISTMLMWS